MRRAAFAAFVVMAVLLSTGPFLWILLTSLKSPEQLDDRPPTVIPAMETSSYDAAFREHDLWSYTRNSLIVAGLTTLVTILLAAPAAYVFARLRLRLRFARGLLYLILAASMFPQLAVVGGVWRLLRDLGLLSTHTGIILPYTALNLPLAIWILTAFFRELPPELEEAARVDGCGPIATLWKVFFPVAAPGVFTAAILVFIYSWNEFFFALLILTDPAVQTLPVGIAKFPGEYLLPWGELAAAAVVATLPLVTLVLILQRRIISGLTAGAVKG